MGAFGCALSLVVTLGAIRILPYRVRVEYVRNVSMTAR